jgi:hypothetical protein
MPVQDPRPPAPRKNKAPISTGKKSEGNKSKSDTKKK